MPLYRRPQGQGCKFIAIRWHLIACIASIRTIRHLLYLSMSHVCTQRIGYASTQARSPWSETVDKRSKQQLNQHNCLHAGHSDDERGHFRGSEFGRSDSGEVEMTEFDRPGMPRNTSASMLDEPAGTRAGLPSGHKLDRMLVAYGCVSTVE